MGERKRRSRAHRNRGARIGGRRGERCARGGGAGRADDGRLEVDEDGARDVLARARLGEEGVERVIAAADRLVGRHLAIGLDAVLKAVELPAGIARLDAGLAEVERDDFAHI